MHGVKDRRLYDVATARWSLAAPAEAEGVQCGLCRPEVSQGGYSWGWARLPCARPTWDQPQPGRWCTVEPDAHYTCCNWPWLPPRLRDAVLEALRDAPRQALQGVPEAYRMHMLDITGLPMDNEATNQLFLQLLNEWWYKEFRWMKKRGLRPSLKKVWRAVRVRSTSTCCIRCTVQYIHSLSFLSVILTYHPATI